MMHRDTPPDDASPAARGSDGIGITYHDATGTGYAVLEKTLLKILSQLLHSVPNPESPVALRLNDRVGLWPASPPWERDVGPSGEWHRQPYLCLYLLLLAQPELSSARDKAAVLAWLAGVQALGAGHCLVVITLDHETVAVAPGASKAWRKFTPLKMTFLRELAAQSCIIAELHPILRPGAERYSILRREAEPLAALMARELGLGLTRRIARYKEELTRLELGVGADALYVDTLEGLAFVYTKVSLFSAALLLYDDWELLLDRHRTEQTKRCLHCGTWFMDLRGECRYHRGKLVSVGRYSLVPKWSCCGAYGEVAPPCVTATVHTVDLKSLRMFVPPATPTAPPHEMPFAPVVASPGASILDPTSHLPVALQDGPGLRQYLLARQSRLLASMGQYVKLGRRLLRFVFAAMRSSKRRAPESVEPLDLEAWCYRVCLEATLIFVSPSLPALPATLNDSGSGGGSGGGGPAVDSPGTLASSSATANEASAPSPSASRAVVLARLYNVMRSSLSQIGVAWFASERGLSMSSADDGWDVLVDELEVSSAAVRDIASSFSPSTPNVSADRLQMRVSVLNPQDTVSLDDPWFVNTDCELQVPPGRFAQDRVSPLLAAHRGLRTVLHSRTAMVDALRKLAGKELLAWREAGRERTVMCATMELANVYFELARFEEAQLLIRSVHTRYALMGWARLHVHCLVLLAECELRLRQPAACMSTCLQLVAAAAAVSLFSSPSSPVAADARALRERYAHRMLKIARLDGMRVLVKPVEPWFCVDVVGTFDAVRTALVVARVRCDQWPVEVVLDRVAVQLHRGTEDAHGNGVESLVLTLTRSPCRLLPGRDGTVELHAVFEDGPRGWRVHKVALEIGSLHLMQLFEGHVHALLFPPPAPPLPADGPRAPPPLVPLDDAVLPQLHPVLVGDQAVVTLFNDPVAALRLRLRFRCDLVECTVWATCDRASLIDAMGALSASSQVTLRPSASLVRGGIPVVAVPCVGREDDAIVLSGALAVDSEVELVVPLRALLLYQSAGSGPHTLEFILACRPTRGGQAHAAFRHVSVVVSPPFAHHYACVVSGGSFVHVVIRVVVTDAVAALREVLLKPMALELPPELFLVSSDCSDLHAPVGAGTVLWFRYCVARSLDSTVHDGDVFSVEGSGDASEHSGWRMRCSLEITLNTHAPYRFDVDLRSALCNSLAGAPLPVRHQLAHELLRGSLSNDPRALQRGDDMDTICAHEDSEPQRSLLDLRGNCVGSEDGALLTRAIGHSCAHVVRLVLENMHMGDAGAIALAESLALCPHLRSLNLFGNSLGTDGIVALCFAAKYRQGGLEELDLGRSSLAQSTAVVSLASLIATSPSLTSLGLWGCSLSDADALDTLVTALAQENSVLLLDLGCNGIGAAGAAHVASWLARDAALTSLSLWYNALGTKGGLALARALQENAALRSLDVRDNGMQNEAAMAFAEVLRCNAVLADLQLQDNDFRDEGYFELAQAVHKHNYTLENFRVVENYATALESLPSIERIATGIKRNRSFKEQAHSSGTFMVHHAELTSIPPQVGTSKSSASLTTLSLDHNHIRYLSSSVSTLTALTCLSLRHNQVGDLSDALLPLRNLTQLLLEDNLIAAAPPALFASFCVLHTLDLSSNRLDAFPECVCVLPSLERLLLARNHIVSLPASLAAHMTRLATLDLSHNRLLSLPPQVALMTALRVLHLDHNALEMLPASLGRVAWDSFRVEDNPLSCIPVSTVAKGSRSVLYYLRDLLSGSDYFYRVKLLVTGQANVGKTTLLSALRNEVGNVNRVLRLLTGKGRRSSTTGIALEDWKPNNSLITFSTWDFGGQLVYYTTHQFFLSKRALYLLVFSMAKGLRESRLVSWLNSIQSRAPGVPVMIVGTHMDDKKRCTPEHVAELVASVRRTITAWERSFPQHERLTILKHTDECWFFPVSSITGDGVARVRSRLMDVAADQPSLRERIPLLYLKLLDVVRLHRRAAAADNVPITTWAQLREWAGFEDETQLERAVQLLHDWGEVLWFSESGALRDVVVLSPQWLTAMFATIIAPSPNSVDADLDAGAATPASPSTSLSAHSESESSAGHSDSDEVEAASPRGRLSRSSHTRDLGIVERSELPQRWAAYDAAHFAYFETLLERFELWLPLDNGQRFLVPCLLPRRGPDEDVGIEWDLVRFGRCFTLPFPLHGLFERCLVQLTRLYATTRHLRRGEAVLRGCGTVTIFAQLRPHQTPAHANGERFLFCVAAAEADLAAARLAVASIMFVVHNFFQDWYNASLHDQVVTEVLCPRCCTADQCGTFELEAVLRIHLDGAVASVQCPLCRASLRLVADLVPEIVDPVHARSAFATDVEELGHVADGASSRVYKGRLRSSSSSELVAVKKLRVHDLTVAWFVEFLQEISMLQQLQHRNLVGVRAAYLRPLCIILEWVGGGTLASAIAAFQGPHNWPLIGAILRDIAVGMSFLHAQVPPVLHRDLRSMNVLVCHLSCTADPVVKIADLGSSCRSLGKVSGRGVHNPRWKPPELFAGAEYTAAADVYCFGLIMWELVGRTIPFHDLNWPSLIVDRILLGARPSLDGLEPLRDDYIALMQHCWAQVPEERPTFAHVTKKVLLI